MEIYYKSSQIICVLIVIFFQNVQANVCETCFCSTSDDTAISINCQKAKFASIHVLRFSLISVEYNGTLTTLDISENNITYLPNDIFQSSRRLKIINLSNNFLEKINANIFKNLNNLEILNLANNRIKSIDPTILPSLRILNLSNNSITDLDLEFHKAFFQLTYLDLSHNNLDDKINGTFSLLGNLLYLDLSYNNFNLLDNEDFYLLTQLVSLNLSHNAITSLSKQIFPNNVLELNVGFNILSTFPSNLSQIQILNIAYNNISDINNFNNGLNNLKLLNVSGNILRTLPNSKIENLEILDLSHNRFVNIPETLSKENYPSLGILLFNENPVSRIEFPSYLNVKSLIMQRLKDITNIDENSFKKLSGQDNHCFNLTLTENSKLQFIDQNAFVGLNLCFLDLKNNQFTYFASNLLNSGFKAKLGVDLEGNPFHCNCSLQWMLDDFVPWLYSNNPDLLINLRCKTPVNLQGKRMVHWYRWKNQVLCDGAQLYSSRMSAETLEVLSRSNSITLHTSSGMLVVLVIAVIILSVLVVIGIALAKRVSLQQTRINRRF